MAGVDEVSEKSYSLLGLYLMAQLGKTRVYVLKAELKMDEKMRILGPNLATC